MKPMQVLDASWLLVESREAPMQVAQLMIFELPDDAEPDFLHQLVAHFKSATTFEKPWNQKLVNPAFGIFLPALQEDPDIDVDYHVRHSALPAPGGEKELGVLISRLHSHQLDFRRPLWECHVIEGLENNRFAMYTKFHHSMLDGVSGVRMLQRILSTDPERRDLPPPWSSPPGKRKRKEKAEEEIPSIASALGQVLGSVREQVTSVRALRRALTRLVNSARTGDDPLKAPFDCPKTILNKRITAQRRFATQQYDIDRIKKLAKAGNCTLNDIVLAICSTALRRFLMDENALPDKPLTAGLPVNVRPADDEGTGNAISFIMVNLATNIADPVERLNAIKESTTGAKEHLQGLPRSAMNNYTTLIMAPFMLQLVSGVGGYMRSVFNITISNVPGPDKPHYYNGARLLASYPVSLIPHGQALNITCLSYAGTLNFGYTGCRDTLPHMQHIAVYSGEALEELEDRLL